MRVRTESENSKRGKQIEHHQNYVRIEESSGEHIPDVRMCTIRVCGFDSEYTFERGNKLSQHVQKQSQTSKKLKTRVLKEKSAIQNGLTFETEGALSNAEYTSAEVAGTMGECSILRTQRLLQWLAALEKRLELQSAAELHSDANIKDGLMINSRRLFVNLRKSQER